MTKKPSSTSQEKCWKVSVTGCSQQKTERRALRLEATHKENIHMLLTDILIPGMNDTELAESLS